MVFTWFSLESFRTRYSIGEFELASSEGTPKQQEFFVTLAQRRSEEPPRNREIAMTDYKQRARARTVPLRRKK